MTLGRCPLSIFCSRGTPPIIDYKTSMITDEDSLRGLLFY